MLNAIKFPRSGLLEEPQNSFIKHFPEQYDMHSTFSETRASKTDRILLPSGKSQFITLQHGMCCDVTDVNRCDRCEQPVKVQSGRSWHKEPGSQTGAQICFCPCIWDFLRILNFILLTYNIDIVLFIFFSVLGR